MLSNWIFGPSFGASSRKRLLLGQLKANFPHAAESVLNVIKKYHVYDACAPRDRFERVFMTDQHGNIFYPQLAASNGWLPKKHAHFAKYKFLFLFCFNCLWSSDHSSSYCQIKLEVSLVISLDREEFLRNYSPSMPALFQLSVTIATGKQLNHFRLIDFSATHKTALTNKF